MIQAVALAEIDGLNDPNQYGEKPFESLKPMKFNEKYWNVFAGGAGQTYGCHAVWQMYTLDRKPINGPLKPWQVSLELPMANQVKHLKNLMLSKSYFDIIPEQQTGRR